MPANEPRPGTPLEFIRKHEDIPSFDIPAYGGERYEDMVPDTLDIQERAALAVNGLTGPTDPDKEHLLYFSVDFSANPPMMRHGTSDMCQAKFMEALPLMRIAGGSDLSSQVDPVWMATALRMIGPDGLVYWPAFPWGQKHSWSNPSPDAPHYAAPWFCGRAISAMTVYMLRDPEGPWRGEIERVVQALNALAVHKGDFAYFPHGGFVPEGPRPRNAEVPLGIWSSLAGWTAQGLAHFYRAAGYEPAGELARKLSRYLRYHGEYFGPNGEFLPNYPSVERQEGARTEGACTEGVHPFDPGPPPDKNHIHFQHHAVPLLGMLDYALAAGDAEMAEFVRASFEWGKGKGEMSVGYFPENIDNTEYEGSETCEVAGMIGLALKLSEAGLGDYWDDADRWTRNQFAENQLRRADWMYRMHMAGLVPPRRRVPLSQLDELTQTTDRVPERNIGAFAGWPSANDFYTGQGNGIMHCCTGNGTRALYYIWEHMLTCRDGELRVNLLLNRPSKWADVHSYIPYEGRVDVRVKEACALKVRIPEWVQPGETTCALLPKGGCTARVGGGERSLEWEGRYAVVGAVSKGDAVQISLPIAERVKEVDIEKRHYILTLRGNDVVNIDPPGRFCPFYQRDHYRDGAVRWKKATRFVSDELLYW
ncbi:MAG: glycoside hydrolase family 127 protein [Candidatus Brocadiia bacterium]|jgi:hypothetical protein|nr:glycoside hydrolase family 127 protein [Candidatus Brocadiia bacterium]